WLDLHLGPCYLLAKLFETRTDRRIDYGVAHAHDDPAEDVGLDAGGDLDLLVRLLPDPVADLLDRALVELDGGGDLDRQQLVLRAPQLVEGAPHPEDRGHAVLLDQQLEEVEEDRVGGAD